VWRRGENRNRTPTFAIISILTINWGTLTIFEISLAGSNLKYCLSLVICFEYPLPRYQFFVFSFTTRRTNLENKKSSMSLIQVEHKIILWWCKERRWPSAPPSFRSVTRSTNDFRSGLALFVWVCILWFRFG
jgi:hypothetical protein